MDPYQGEYTREIEDLRKRLSLKETYLNEKDELIRKISEELKEVNSTIGVLAKNIDFRKTEYETKVHQVVVTKIQPLMAQLKKEVKIANLSTMLELLEYHVNNLTHRGLRLQRNLSVLTETEMKVAALVKSGLSTNEIANLLCVSNETVKKHRKNIRKKLKISGSDINLSKFLNQ